MEALATTQAKVVYISNLVNKPGQTDGLSVAGHAAEIERFAGGRPILDYVLYNTAEPPTYLTQKYTKQGELLVPVIDAEFNNAHYEVVGLPLIATEAPTIQKGDPLATHRSYIRHDPELLAQAVLKVTSKQ